MTSCGNPAVSSGWAATVTFNPHARAEFERFRRRDDTLSLGVCNGCQLLALLGWVGGGDSAGKEGGPACYANRSLVTRILKLVGKC